MVGSPPPPDDGGTTLTDTGTTTPAGTVPTETTAAPVGETVIEIDHVTKRFDDYVAVDNAHFSSPNPVPFATIR